MKKTMILALAAVFSISLFIGDNSPVYGEISGQDEFTLEEITVTAQKREENLQKVPITMEVITGDQMKELGHTNIQDVLGGLASAIINKQSDGLRVTLRGIVDDSGTFSNLTTASPAVAFTTDGVYSARNDQGSGFFDVERIEVLVGPQSTLYSSSAPGGVINVVTTDPKLDDFEGSALFEYGNYHLIHTEGAINAPLIEDKLALRVAFSSIAHDGYISDGTDDEDTKSARVKALFQANDELSFQLAWNVSTKSVTGAMGKVDAFEYEEDVEDPWTITSSTIQPLSKSNVSGLNLTMNWDTGIGTLTVIPAVNKNKSNWGQSDVTLPGSEDSYTSYTDLTHKEKGVEARMVSSDDFELFKWILGTNYYKSDQENHQIYTGSPTYTHNAIHQEVSAFYGNITYPVTNAFRVNAGMRRTDYWVESKQDTYNNIDDRGPGYIKFQTDNGLWTLLQDLEREYTGSDYKIGLEYDLGSNTMVYVDYSTSYRVQSQVDYGPNYEYQPPEKLKAYSIGAKNRFFDNKMQLNVSLYYNDYKNKGATGEGLITNMDFYEDDPRFIEAGLTADDGTSGLDLNGDGTITHEIYQLHEPWNFQWGDFISRGMDIQSKWIISERDKLDVSYSYCDDYWTNMLFQYYYDMVYPTINYNDKTNVHAPKHTLNVSYDHMFTLPNGGTLTPLISARYQSEYIVTYRDIDHPYNYQEPYWTGNLSAVYSSPEGNYTISAYVKNITNYAVKESYGSSGGGSAKTLMIGPPRTYGAILSIKF